MLPVDISKYSLFLSVMAVMAITPGPANLFAVATGMRAGRRAALRGVFGMNCGTLIWFCAAALGLGTLVRAFPMQFHLIALIGGLYIAWLGCKSLWSAMQTGSSQFAIEPPANARGTFRQGLAIQLSNPKAILLFTAVLPPFLDPNRPIVPQIIAFAAATITMDFIAMSLYGLFGSTFSKQMTNPATSRVFSGISGLLLLLAAVLILTSH